MAKQTKLTKEKKKPVVKKTKDKSFGHSTKLNKPSKKTVKTKLKKTLPEDHYFVLLGGHKIKNVKELADALEMIDEHHFKHHANDDKNDFANWIKDVFEEFDLAEKIKTAKNKDHARLIIYKYISNSFW